jgi:hypothetical protein
MIGNALPLRAEGHSIVRGVRSRLSASGIDVFYVMKTVWAGVSCRSVVLLAIEAQSAGSGGVRPLR